MESEDPCMHFDMGHTMMAMSFHLGYCENVLFDTWKVRSVETLIGSMFGIIGMAILYEGLKAFREHLFWKDGQKKKTENMPAMKLMFGKAHLIQTGLHVVQVILSYFLMLIVMYYNVWLFIAVVLGATIGHYIFGWQKLVLAASSNTKPCAEKTCSDKKVEKY
ncbi:Hypothetical predicted protein [Cloeon dipterum]|uniref:Copper transport protein n=2 Tax=Cloeon dipterum TaxID=197152 RepID=A0A8S1DJH6_9INSE|nr:Hypothetical predicted protein [Cloeon dipterum]